ncbi:MAG: cytochrome c-552 precursor [Gammaproteobacteria bacterium]|nr:cytochrome c-552 precursor [Gammaproteobacteria bacterium]
MNTYKRLSIVILLFVNNTAFAIDWSKVTAKQMTLFYPGQSSWEWLLTANDHSGAKNIRKGKTCIECHAEEEPEMGTTLLATSQTQLALLKGKSGSMLASVKMAYDTEMIYVQISWKDGKTQSTEKIDKEYASRVTLMLDDGHVTEAARAGCWSTCHDDAMAMPSADANKDISKYLARSRTKITRNGGGENYKPAEDLNAMISNGIFMEFWQARLNTDQPAIAVDGYILDQRHRNEQPLVTVKAALNDGRWTVEFSRKLLANAPLHKNIISDQSYVIGFAIHDDYANHRHHFVSFGRSFVLEQGDADFVLKRQ